MVEKLGALQNIWFPFRLVHATKIKSKLEQITVSNLGYGILDINIQILEW